MNSGSSRAVSILKNGSWMNLNFDYLVSKPTISKIIFDKNDYAWMILARSGGIMVYKDVNGLSQPSTTNTKILSVAKGNGFLPTPDIYSICEDLDGKIWVGTAKGITVFYNPENIFTNTNFDSQQILIEQDNYVQILLENDIITSIAVDGVNRKWVGTESSGVYCFSSDGQTQIYHFTTDNSPLYSNVVRDIVTDETTGDVFIATEKGVQSYRTSIIKGYENFTNMHAFPNPIKPGYTGTIHITGLIDEASVKITDVAGNLVWESKSQGGQLEWDLKNFSGSRVTSGVYLIYGSSANGEKTENAKLLFIN
jgi:ligand-binding sensor domain-containing protein